MRITGAKAFAVAMIVSSSVTQAAEFQYTGASSQDMARRLDMPVFFALPESARLALPKTINTTDRLIDFRHPDAGLLGILGNRADQPDFEGVGRLLDHAHTH